MESIIKTNENLLKMVQGLKAKRNYSEALAVCNNVLENLKPIASNISENTDSIQLMAIAVGEISEIYEKKNELQCALEYKKLQCFFLSYIKYQEFLLTGDQYEFDEDIFNKNDLLVKLNEIQQVTIHLSNNPEEAMDQILKSLERTKEKKVNSTIKSIINTQNVKHQNLNEIELTKFEKFIEFIFIHPFSLIFLIIFVLTISIFLMTRYFRTKQTIPKNAQKRIKEITNYISKIKDIKNPENIKNTMGL